MQIRDAVDSLHNCQEFSQLPQLFRWGYGNTEKNSSIAFIKYFSKIIKQMKENAGFFTFGFLALLTF